MYPSFFREQIITCNNRSFWGWWLPSCWTLDFSDFRQKKEINNSSIKHHVPIIHFKLKLRPSYMNATTERISVSRAWINMAIYVSFCVWSNNCFYSQLIISSYFMHTTPGYVTIGATNARLTSHWFWRSPRMYYWVPYRVRIDPGTSPMPIQGENINQHIFVCIW